jgi:spoIIIJ-associated protein
MSANVFKDGKFDRDAAVAELRKFFDLIVSSTHLAVQYEITLPPLKDGKTDAAEIFVDFRGEDEALLLERQAELLLALEHIALRWLRLQPEHYDLIRFDSGGFRALRVEELKLSARVAAQRVRETHDAFHFNPMPARDRRLIHLELTNAPGVRTNSEGVGERRHLVIYPTETKR